jgi:hypothetical protein
LFFGWQHNFLLVSYSKELNIFCLVILLPKLWTCFLFDVINELHIWCFTYVWNAYAPTIICIVPNK